MRRGTVEKISLARSDWAHLDWDAAVGWLVVVSDPVRPGVLGQSHEVVSALPCHELSLQFLPLPSPRLQ